MTTELRAKTGIVLYMDYTLMEIVGLPRSEIIPDSLNG